MVPALGIKCTTAEIRAINEVGINHTLHRTCTPPNKGFTPIFKTRPVQNFKYSKQGFCRISNIQNQVVEDCLEVALSAQLEVEQIEMEEEVRMIMWMVRMIMWMVRVFCQNISLHPCLFSGDGEHSRRVQGCGGLPLLYRSQVLFSETIYKMHLALLLFT